MSSLDSVTIKNFALSRKGCPIWRQCRSASSTHRPSYSQLFLLAPELRISETRLLSERGSRTQLSRARRCDSRVERTHINCAAGSTFNVRIGPRLGFWQLTAVPMHAVGLVDLLRPSHNKWNPAPRSAHIRLCLRNDRAQIELLNVGWKTSDGRAQKLLLRGRCSE